MLEETKVRDQLAKDRTELANERTFLAYARTSLGLLGLAVVCFKFLDATISVTLGLACLVAGFAVFFWGIRSYRAIAQRIKSDEAELES